MNAKTKHGGAVDIRGILERAGADAEAPEGSQAWGLAQVYRVVAQLVEAAQDVIDDTVDASTYPDGPCISRKERAALKAALANIRSAS
jgi:hypothetical protein